ncbi:DNA topoisomerase III [Rossellomorea marisflavi]|uniref:DNA topoisomerase III n=1 Tax=Rossellomorea marisflavi TaxID=189381 RepID=UPI001EE2BBAE|nr:DNA topoisomerase III [Rossellomorea marisflavi]UKS63509.1 DNA topoisomerase III [Rossellomorea marisflavi]
MKLVIAEKPDQGATLAKPFPHKKRQGYIEIQPNPIFPNGAYVTWAVGHLLQLKSPEKYESSWKKWSLDTLPIVPDRFQYEVQRSKSKQYNVIKSLLQKDEVSEIIHAGDAGREGELIVRNITTMAKARKPMKRLWISSLTEKAIVQGFQNLKDESETRSLYHEAYSRACADWLVGMNASRAYSLLLQGQGMSDVFSAGRVQTPTLALIVKREEEIERFKSEPFWEVKATFNMEGNLYEGTWVKDGNTRIQSKEMAEKIAAFCQKGSARVKEVKTERKEFAPPMLFNLSSLQATINKMYKFSPKKTLDILQKLYQKGIVSYPRSDSQHVTKGEAEAFPEILSKLSQFKPYSEWIVESPPSLMNNKRFVNDQKVSDHYAIIPTEQVKDPAKLSEEERKIYDVVIRRLIAAHHDKAIIDYTSVSTLVEERAEFSSKGKQIIQEGWRKVIVPTEKDNDVILPPLSENQKGMVTRASVKEGKTQPPKRYTEGQLITLMKTAGKHIENDELEKVLKATEGLGTEATRAGIITMLKDRQYIFIQKNIVYPTDKARVLIRAVGHHVLASAEMTAKWEQRLQEIGKGQASAPEFMEQVKKLSASLVKQATEESNRWDFNDLDTSSIQRERGKGKGKSRVKTPVGTCPKCGGKVIPKGKFYGCSEYSKTKCSFSISKKILSKTIPQAQVKKLLKDGRTDRIDGFKKGEKEFSAYLGWDPQARNIQFLFDVE